MKTIVYPDPQLVARHFCAILSKWLKPAELAKVKRLNKIEKRLSVCHSHDFCDANQAMLDAFENAGLRPCSTGGEDIGPMDAECERIWNEAWTMARVSNFCMKLPPRKRYILKFRQPVARKGSERWAKHEVDTVEEAVAWMNAEPDFRFRPAAVETRAWKPTTVAILG